MDESDKRLVEALQKSIAEGRYEVGMDDDRGRVSASARSGDGGEAQEEGQPVMRHATFEGSAAGGGDGASKDPLPADDGADGAFNRAMNAYRAARAAGDAQAMAAAQAEMQEVVRREMAEAEQPCQEKR